ncbi:MAG: BlaI/MecI/CopY family transcriptional regulator [Bacteroidales bacterium]|jgi:predicted transcriptional regulator|nr:BlaI/MecI/CopY family transcriptional regulator [Bacteroidales bacterium]
MRKKHIGKYLTLTRAEEEIMQLLWKNEHAFVNELLDMMPEPKPAYNTVSTIVRILEQKEFVGYRRFGRTHQYYPLVSQSQYLSNSLSRLSSTYFQNSYANLVNFFAEEGNLKQKDIKEIEELLNTLKKVNNKKVRTK